MGEQSKNGHYDLSQVKPGESGASVPTAIRLPDDEQRLLALAAKLAEYESRPENGEYFPPDMVRPVARYKEEVLGRLLVDGEVFTRDLMAEFSEEPDFDAGEMEEAVRVIEDYATTGGAGNVGGSGLRVPSGLRDAA